MGNFLRVDLRRRAVVAHHMPWTGAAVHVRGASLVPVKTRLCSSRAASSGCVITFPLGSLSIATFLLLPSPTKARHGQAKDEADEGS